MTSIRSLAVFNGAPLGGAVSWVAPPPFTAQGQHTADDTSYEEWGLLLATSGDLHLATGGDFFMATDSCSCLTVADFPSPAAAPDVLRIAVGVATTGRRAIVARPRAP